MKLYAPLVKGEIEKAAYNSFTTDIWTNMSNTAFIILMAHFIDPVDIAEGIYTYYQALPDSHTGINISEVLNEILDETQNMLKSTRSLMRLIEELLSYVFHAIHFQIY